MTKAIGFQPIDSATSTGVCRYRFDALYTLLPSDEPAFEFDLFASIEPTTDVGLAKLKYMDGTTSGPRSKTIESISQTTGEAILEIRRLSGLTWELLSELFDVSRRTVHHWANGSPASAKHERHIRQTSYVMRQLYRGSQRATRDLLFMNDDGKSIFDLFAEQEYDRILSLALRIGTFSSSGHRKAQVDNESNKRIPTRPELLIDARHDRPESPVGTVNIVRPFGSDKPKE